MERREKLSFESEVEDPDYEARKIAHEMALRPDVTYEDSFGCYYAIRNFLTIRNFLKAFVFLVYVFSFLRFLKSEKSAPHKKQPY